MTHKGEHGMDAAIEQLKNHQQQLDAEGITVGVSRQALDEVLTGIDALKAENEQRQETLRWAFYTLGEINISNYDHDDVCNLNDKSVEVIIALKQALGDTDG